jgi:hypothetical protein
MIAIKRAARIAFSIGSMPRFLSRRLARSVIDLVRSGKADRSPCVTGALVGIRPAHLLAAPIASAS